ncbi:MAG: tail fiber protein [Patulibacter minatonensis]
MADPFVGEIRLFGGNFAPLNWADCDGQLLAIDDYAALYNLLGTTFGGNGVTTFGVPDLRGRVPVHVGPGYVQGQMAGTESVTLINNQIPAHTHAFVATTAQGLTGNASNALLGSPTDVKPYRTASPAVNLSGTSISAAGGSQPHDNIQPSLAVRYIISLYGIYPTQA